MQGFLLRGKELYKSAFCHFKLLLIIFVFLSITTTTLAQELYPDLAGEPNFINFADFAVLAENWQRTAPGLEGDFDDNGTVDLDDLAYLSLYWLAEYSEYQECQRMDLNDDGIIAFEDFAMFAQNWLSTGVGLAGDFDDSNSVDCDDLAIMTDCWLKGSRPEGIWEQFKAALATGDTETALTFIAERSQDRYSEIFQAIGLNLTDYAVGMGTLTLQSQDENRAVYDMTHQVGMETYLFPIIFIKDEQGNWKICNF